MEAIAVTVNKVPLPLNPQDDLPLMKGLSGADLLVCDEARQPLEDDHGRPMTTLHAVPGDLPAPAEHTAGDLGAPVRVAGTPYFARGVPLHHARPGLYLYVFYPEALWRDALWQAVRPALFLGVLGGLAAAVLTFAVTQRR